MNNNEFRCQCGQFLRIIVYFRFRQKSSSNKSWCLYKKSNAGIDKYSFIPFLAFVQMRMDQYFQRIQAIVEKRQTSSRVRFMLTDTMDLRKNNWVPRRDESAPKTIEQIHKEAEEEKVQKEINSARMAAEMSSRRSKGKATLSPKTVKNNLKKRL